jgi:acetyl esterase/lipase
MRRVLALSGMRLLSAVPPGFDLISGIEVPSGAPGRSLRLHIARPKRSRGPRPAVAYVFGGGWESNGPDQGLLPICGLAMRGYVGVSIDYRLSHEALFPAQLEDCKCCIRYLRANAENYGIDTARIGVLGLSSGGHLAALLGTTAVRPELEGGGGWLAQSSAVQAVATWAPPVDLALLTRDHGSAASATSTSARLIGGPVAEKHDQVAYLTAAAPPFFLAHGARDHTVPPNQSRLLYDALRTVGVPVEMLVLPKKGHGFLGLKALRHTMSFFDRELRERHP